MKRLALALLAASLPLAASAGPDARRLKRGEAMKVFERTPTGRHYRALAERHAMGPVEFARESNGRFDGRLYVTDRLWDMMMLYVTLAPELYQARTGYLSWVLAHAHVVFEADTLAADHGVMTFPVEDFVEVDQWAMLVAMRHWRELKELGDPGVSLEDFAPAAVGLELGVDRLYALYERDLDAFLSEIASRRLRKGLPSPRAADWLANRRLTTGERATLEAFVRNKDGALALERGRRAEQAARRRHAEEKGASAPRNLERLEHFSVKGL